MKDWFRCSPLGRGWDFLEVSFLESWLTPFSMSPDDSGCPGCPAHPPCIPSPEQSPQPGARSCLCARILLLLHSDKHKPAPFAGYFLDCFTQFSPSHGKLLLVLAFNAILLFSYYVSLPLYLSMKMNKIKFCSCMFLLSVVAAMPRLSAAFI